MKLALTLAFIAWPLIEIALLIEAGRALGFWPTMGIVVGTGLLGLAVIAQNGLETTVRVQRALQRDELPVAPMAEGALVVVAGFLLLTPGLFADVVGLVLLVPPLRRLVIARLVRVLFGEWRQTPGHEARADRFEEASRPPRADRGNGQVIDGEFTRLDERPARPDADKPGLPPKG